MQESTMAKEKGNVISEYHLNRHQPDLPQLAIHDLNSYIKDHQGETARPHIHSFYQVIWFKRGKGKHFVDFKAYEVSDNILFFVTKNQVHYFDGNTRYEGVLIHFNEAFLMQKENEAEFCFQCSLFNHPYQPPSCRIGNGIGAILDEYIAQIKSELESKEEFGKKELLRNYLKSFLIQVQRRKNEQDKAENNIASVPDEKRMQLIRLVNLVDENYHKGLAVAEYARMLFVSPRTLSDLTHQLLNKTPSQIIQERIILEAQRLLLYSSLNVNQISYRLGFADASYFVKYFRKHTKTSPSEFRKSVA